MLNLVAAVLLTMIAGVEPETSNSKRPLQGLLVYAGLRQESGASGFFKALDM